MVQRIAIIGSGMAGLAASWFLGQDHRVTLFERQGRLGIGAHSIETPGGVVDVPLRVIYPGYYPQLFALLSETGVQLEALDAAISFSDVGERSYFRYRNLQAFGKTLPWVTPEMGLRPASRSILWDLARFLWQTPLALAEGALEGRTLGDFLDTQGYSSAFSDRFLVPAFAGINTVSCQEVRDYPAALIAQYFNRNFVMSSVYRAVGGAQLIAQTLSARAADVRLNAHIQSVRRRGNRMVVTSENGKAENFDAVIFATQANQVASLLDDATDTEQSVLGAVRYGDVRVVMHDDPRLMPVNRADWAPVNYLVSPDHDRPMVSIWVNRLLPAYRHARPVFQTINPLCEPDAARVMQDSRLQRPIVNLATQANLKRLDALHAEPRRRVFFCGAYAAQGIPLLEGAVVSAQRLAEILAK